MDVNQAASLSAAQASQKIQDTVNIKMLKLAQDQQKTVGDLVSAAAASAEQILSQEPGKGANLDVVA